jgi:hypothetical protein
MAWSNDIQSAIIAVIIKAIHMYDGFDVIIFFEANDDISDAQPVS